MLATQKKVNLYKMFLVFLSVAVLFSLALKDAEADLCKKANKAGVVYWYGDTAKNKIALTFDDGPNDPYTLEILDILKEYNIKATFFVIGKNVEAFPEIAKRIAQEGHCIGNHTYSHPGLLLKNRSQIAYQIKKAAEVISAVTGTQPYLFRSPYGAHNPRILAEASKMNYIVINWSVSGLNGRQDLKYSKIVYKVISNIQNGSIILLHDGNRLSRKPDRSQIVKALPLIIEILRHEGYEFVTIPELLDLE